MTNCHLEVRTAIVGFHDFLITVRGGECLLGDTHIFILQPTDGDAVSSDRSGPASR